MPVSEVLNNILDDFTANNPELVSAELKAFCEYAATWLATQSVIGVGSAASGLSLRFADGRELLLFEPRTELATPVPGNGNVVNITGTQNKITKPFIDSAPSFSITGR